MTQNLRIVMVHTTHPGNIGAAARAMKNMCLSELVLVTPRDFPNVEATARASGADDILARARVVDTLAEAISDCRVVIGASARSLIRVSDAQSTEELARLSADLQGLVDWFRVTAETAAPSDKTTDSERPELAPPPPLAESTPVTGTENPYG